MPSTTATLSTPRPDTDARAKAMARKPNREMLSDSEIARLSSQDISQMSRNGLVRTVCLAATPAAGRRLTCYDRATLERLAYQARLCCQHRLA